MQILLRWTTFGRIVGEPLFIDCVIITTGALHLCRKYTPLVIMPCNCMRSFAAVKLTICVTLYTSWNRRGLATDLSFTMPVCVCVCVCVMRMERVNSHFNPHTPLLDLPLTRHCYVNIQIHHCIVSQQLCIILEIVHFKSCQS